MLSKKKEFFKNICKPLFKHLFRLLPERNARALGYYYAFNRFPNLKTPKTFNEKINWLLLHDKRPLITQLADKHAVRSYVKNKIGDQFLNQLYAVYQNINNIDLNKLPNAFVIKAAHGSGWNFICKNKNRVNWNKTKKQFSSWLKQNYYHCQLSKEWCYKNIKPVLICEKYLKTNNGELLDYKIFCFNGIPQFIEVDSERFTAHKRDLYNLNWQKLPFSFKYLNSNKEFPKPKHLELMLDIAKKLSEDLIFARIDLYEVNNKVIFGEITFYPEGGYGNFYPAKYDMKLGNALHIHL